MNLVMKSFRDWRLRSKLLVGSAALVIGVTLATLAAFSFALGNLRQAIPEQRAILNLSTRSFDYLSEIRQFALAPESGARLQLGDIEAELVQLMEEYEVTRPAQVLAGETPADEIRHRIEGLLALGRQVIVLEDSLSDILERVEVVEREGREADEPLPAAAALSNLRYDYLSELREYLLDPTESTLAEIEEIESGIDRLSAAAELDRSAAATAAPRDRTRAIVDIGRSAIDLRQEMQGRIERLEDAEQSLIDKLHRAADEARSEVEQASQVLLWSVFGTGLFGLTLAAFLAFRIADGVSRPVRILDDASRRFVAGELATRVRVESADELGDLARSFNRLAEETQLLISELRRSKAYNESIVSSVPLGLVAVDEGGRITSANPVFGRRWSAPDLVGSRLSRLIPALEPAIDSVLSGEHQDLDVEIRREAADGAGDGEIFEVSVVEIRAGESGDRLDQPADGAGALVVFEDVTESRGLTTQLEQNLEDLKRTQAQLVQSGKLAAVGELAAGVAHELNNPLSVVLTYSILLEEKLGRASQELREQLPKFEERLEMIKVSAERCKSIVDNLLLFSRQEAEDSALVDLPALLRKTLDLVASQLRHRKVRAHLDIEAGLPPIRGIFNQLQQVVINLAVNSMQAMETGGDLTITARRHESDCELIVADTGKGIPQEHLGRVFDPFFTTKPAGEGTGLGLSIIYGIIRQHGGDIAVESVLGQGATFRIRLPLADLEKTG